MYGKSENDIFLLEWENVLTKYNKISLIISPIANSIHVCRPQNVHIAWITLTPTAVAAADTVLSKWWYLLAVVHGALLCYCTLTPYTTMHTSCV